MTKADLSNDLYKTVGLSKSDSTDMVEYFFEEIASSLINGQEVKISGFGNFFLRDKRERPGRNPKTKKPAAIKARRVVTYKPSQKVKDRLQAIKPQFVEISKKRAVSEDIELE